MSSDLKLEETRAEKARALEKKNQQNSYKNSATLIKLIFE
jgi:hypothetical protein